MCKWPWVTSTTIKASFTGKSDQFKKLKKSFVQSWYKGRHSRPIMGWKRMSKMTLGGWPDQSYESAPSYLGRRRTCYQSQPVRYRPLSWNWQSIPDVFFNGHWQESSLHVGLVKKKRYFEHSSDEEQLEICLGAVLSLLRTPFWRLSSTGDASK